MRIRISEHIKIKFLDVNYNREWSAYVKPKQKIK